ncbi:phage tail protein [Sphingomonas endophytica]|uniref:Uncharacterized protein n=1 Tax=Sphingomonas endophytica TaxID=869719 RepID=A0A147HUV0_9SPHN|nr:phage tail protein [Sphingomonas endophytica]KTT68652.1 hypothetical protein NS334_16120 [Sphingomonas endophytica]
MATLVLTVVGGAIGGPVGAAVGAAVGQAIDREVLFAPKGRQGPRLSDLKIQTSSYGAQIPKVFGTMRVAGCVIWATELIETRSTARGGKGRPSVTGYQYAASFAVALSARPIVGVGRIWAEGKLLRGAAGDWKTPALFRLYRGDERQVSDPLIASIEGHAPAHRGLAYAVFENLPLADFGNRIPALTFEVIGDGAPPAIGAVARELGAGAIVGAGPATALHGYAASGDSVAGALETLATVVGAWWVPSGDALRMVDAAGAALALDDDVAVTELRRPIETVPRQLGLSCYDPARDYQIGVQQAQRPAGAGWRDVTIDVPAALDATQARGVAQATIRRAEQARVTRRVTLDATAIGIAPGDALSMPGGAGTWRATRVTVEGRGVTLDMLPVTPAPVALPADAGQVRAAPDRLAAGTVLVAAELPPLDDVRVETVRIAVFASGDRPGWRGAALLTSDDGGASWEAAGAAAAPAVLGSLAAPAGDGSERLVDRMTAVDVLLAHDDMVLLSIDDTALDRGGNLAFVGGELLQFRDAVRLGPGRWRLTTLLRGRRGTAARAHATGAAFVLVEAEAMAMLVLPRARVGETIRLLASGSGDAQPAATQVLLTGASIAPPAPVRLRATRTATGTTLRWVRRSRLGWRWDDGLEVPLGEEREAYAVTIGDGAEARPLMSDAPVVTLPAGTRRATVRQQGMLAMSPAVEIMISEGDGR